jgi:AraC family transcriptional activator of pobA
MPHKIPTFELYGDDISVAAQFWIHSETIAARSSLYHWEIGVHRHRSLHQLFVIRSGVADITIEGRVVRIEPPAAITMPAEVSHGFRFSSDTDGLVITVLSHRLEAIIGSLAGHPLFTDARVMHVDQVGADGPAMLEIAGRLAAEIEAYTPQKIMLLEGYLKVIYALLARLSADGSKDMPDQTRKERTIERFLALLYREMRSEHAVAFYAGSLGISETHLNRVCKSVTGLSSQMLIAGRLIEEAKRQLIFTASSVQAIALGLGFSDAAYFNRFFRRHAGNSPQAWRRAWQDRSEARR